MYVKCLSESNIPNLNGGGVPDLISVIIPTYNSAKFIEKCICSVLEQSYEKIEILVIDDKSEDNTVAIVHSLMKTDARIELIELQYNSGPAFARQQGIKKSQGYIITFVDSDDMYCDKDALIKIKKAYDDNEVDCVMFGYRTIHEKGIVITKKFNSRYGIYSAKEVAEAKSDKPSAYWHYLWNKCYKAELLRSNTLFQLDLRVAEDVRFNDNFLRICKSLYVMRNTYLYCYNCTNDNNISGKKIVPSLERAKNQFKHQKDDLIRLKSDYIELEASDKAIDGLYKQFMYYALVILENNRSFSWNKELEYFIKNDNAYIECISKFGNLENKIKLKLLWERKIMKIKSQIKRVIRL